MSEVFVMDLARAGEEWRSFHSISQVRDFFSRVTRALLLRWKAKDGGAIEKQLQFLTDFADAIPRLSSDDQIRAYSRGAIDVLIEQGTELLNETSTAAERLISGELTSRFGKNHLRIIACLYDRPLRQGDISKDADLDASYVSRLLKDLESSGIVQRVGAAYGLTHAGINAHAKTVEPGWTHKARRFLVAMWECLDKVGTFPCDLLVQSVRRELNVPAEIAERLVLKSLSDLEAKGRLSIRDGAVIPKPTPFAIAEALNDVRVEVRAVRDEVRVEVPAAVRDGVRAALAR